jgi:CCR4-NOT transcriptional regulation complex NOT5 subunit
MPIVRHLLTATAVALLATSVSLAGERDNEKGVDNDHNSKSVLDSTGGATPTVDGMQKNLNSGASDPNANNTKTPLLTDSKDGSKSSNDDLHHPSTGSSEGETKDKGLRDIDTNVVVHPSLDHRKVEKDTKDAKGVKDHSYKTFAVPKGKFVSHDKKIADIGPETSRRNALGTMLTPKDANASGDSKTVNNSIPSKNSLGVTLPEIVHREPDKKDSTGVVPGSAPTPSGPSINGTTMEKPIVHSGAIGGAKLNLAGISGNTVHYKH